MDKDDVIIKMESIYVPSQKIVARDIEGEIIIVPIESGFADLNDALYSLNETGKSIWELLAPDRSVKDICTMLEQEYDVPSHTIENDVQTLLKNLLNMGIIVEIK